MAQPETNTTRVEKTWKPFFLSISLIIVLFLSGIFLGLIIRTNALIENQMITNARAHFRNILLTRRWNASYGGVFVLKREGVVSNPYLIDPDIKTVDGQTYTKKNPALMTREISEYARQDGDYVFHITSLRPLNPGNRPDDFERQALTLFNEGGRELYTVAQTGHTQIFRYMAPLKVEDSCMACHAVQGYNVGDIRGGISVSFDITSLMKKLLFNKIAVATLSLGTTTILLTLIYMLVLRFRRRLNAAYEAIEMMSITDELTQVYNRRHFINRLAEETARACRHKRPVSLMILDLDFFKKVNDNYGHPAGDAVLRQAARIVKDTCRKSDPVARYGGEEFVAILVEADLEGSETAAEKVRRAVEEHAFDLGDGRTIHVTASIGTACLSPDTGPVGNRDEWLINRADSALYRAKADGRNRVVAYRESMFPGPGDAAGGSSTACGGDGA